MTQVLDLALDHFSARVDREQRVVHLAGELDLASAPVLERVVAELVDAGRGDITVDCGELSFIDSQGLNLLADLERDQVIRGTTLALARVDASPRRAFLAAGLAGMLPSTGS
jgi:anti-sigma B factor antagonist